MLFRMRVIAASNSALCPAALIQAGNRSIRLRSHPP